MNTVNPDSENALGEQAPNEASPGLASELNNLLQIISGTSALLENVWAGKPGSEKYFAMLRSGVERAEKIAAQLVKQAGGSEAKVLMHPDLTEFTRLRSVPPRTAPAQKQRILVVDDEEVITALCEQTLIDAGFEVVTARSGFECLDFFRRRPRDFHLVLLDLAMPVMSGEETFERLIAISSDVPVVITTGFVDKERLDRMMAAGLAGYLRKPHGPAELVLYVRAIIESFHLSRPGAAMQHAAGS